MPLGSSKIYVEDAKKGVVTTYFIQDLSTRAPIIMNPPEPDPEMIVRPLAKYGVYLGKTYYLNLPYYWDPLLLANPMMAIIGMPGAGKSEMLKTLIIRMKKKGVDKPVIIVDPEGEYYTIVDQLGEGVVLNIGTEDYVNIFDRPSCQYNYQLWVRKAVIPGLLKALKISPAQAPLMMSVLEQTIERVYEEIYKFSPIDPRTWCRGPEPTLKDVVDMLGAEVEAYTSGRVKEKKAVMNAKMSLYHRMRRWVSGEGSDFFAYPSTVKLQDLLTQSIVVFNIKALPREAKDLFTYYIFSYFYALMESLPPLPRAGLRLMLVFDEGWILLKKEKGEESALAELFRRARKYGFGAIIATQQYRDVAVDILPLVGTVMILRIRDADAVEKLRRTLRIPKRIAQQISTLPTGTVVVAPAWRSEFQNSKIPFLVKVETAVKRRVPVVVYYTESVREIFRKIRSVT